MSNKLECSRRGCSRRAVWIIVRVSGWLKTYHPYCGRHYRETRKIGPWLGVDVLGVFRLTRARVAVLRIERRRKGD